MAEIPENETTAIRPLAGEPALPHIPDHQLVRFIGRGGYGEVWLARTILGAYRAVKIVYRKDFANDRPYEREFSGIKRFEPVSRSHDSQVAILHVGRDDKQGYFFYIMELADDQMPSRVLNPETYSPRTLESEIRKRGPLPPHECRELAIALTDALSHLHQSGLIHRDIKPANIIFVNGRPKLADIGLVAGISDTNSFVGTDGYIPPEGPGTPQADIYSLGIVLYEITTGRDRRDFPALPTELHGIPGRPQVLALNHVILKACDHVRTRYRSAIQMQADIIRLTSGARAKKTHRFPIRRLIYAAAALIVLAVFLLRQGSTGTAFITTDPPGAALFVGEEIAPTENNGKPTQRLRLPVGTNLITARYQGLTDVVTSIVVRPRTTVNHRLGFSYGSATITSDPSGAAFRAGSGFMKTPYTIPVMQPGPAIFQLDLSGHDTFTLRGTVVEGEHASWHARLKVAQPGEQLLEVTSVPPGATIVDGQGAEFIVPARRFLAPGSHQFVARYRDWPQKTTNVTVQVGTNSVNLYFEHARVSFDTQPRETTVWHGTNRFNATDTDVLLPAGLVELRFEAPGYGTNILRTNVVDRTPVRLAATLPPKEYVDATTAMEFVWIQNLGYYVGRYEVTQREYESIMGQNPSAHRGNRENPVDSVSWADAWEFCQRLSQRSPPPPGFRYTLPTRAQWEAFAANALRDPSLAVIKNAPIGPSPRGSLPANYFTLHDVRGNVWEWTLEKVIVGSSFKSPVLGLPPWRPAGENPLTYRDDETGFRVIVSPVVVPSKATL
jgi:hypothetical protein